MFGQSLLSGAFGTALVPDENFGIDLYTGTGASQVIGGKIKGSALFNGSNTGMVVPGNMGTLLGNQFSVSFWFYAPTTFPSSGYPTFVSLYGYPGYGSAYGWSIEYPNSGKIMFYWVSSSGVGNNIQSSALTPGKWCHVIVTKDSTSANIYINNVLDNATTSVSSNAMWYNGFEQLTIGCKRNAGAGGATSSHISDPVDQMRIFTSVLTSAERAAVYAEDSSTANTLNFPTGASCVAAYQFDNNVNGPLNTAKISTCDFPSGAGCQALYQFNNTSNDTCGNYNLTEVGSPSYVTGPFGKAIQFNGTSQGVTSTSAIIPNSAATISLWYNGNGTSTAEFYIIGVGVGSGSTGLDIHYYNGNFYGGLVDAGTFKGVGTGSTSINTSTWYHLALTWDGSTSANSMKLYINGILETNITPTVAASSLTYSSFGIGKTSTATYAPGIVDQVRIFNTALSASQITELARGAGSAKNAEDINNNIAFNGWVNFKPDVTWIKNIANGVANSWHTLTDSVRGGGIRLFPNSPNAEAADNYDVLSFQNNGFTIGTGTYVSYNGGSYASWNWKAGADTYAGLFNGSTSKFKITSPLGIEASNENDNFSISMWVTWDSVDASSGSLLGTLVGDIAGSTYGSFHIYVYGLGAGNGLSLGFERYFNGTGYYNSSYNTVGTLSSLVAHRWYNVTHTYVGSSKEVKLYLDGTLITTYTLDSSAGGRTTNIYNVFGDYDDRGAHGHAGKIDQIRMFNTTLTSTQINSLVSEGLSDNNTLDFPTGAGCTAAYTFDDTANSVVNEADLGTCDFPTGAGCQALYQLNNTVTDTCGNYNGTGTAITYTRGVFGSNDSAVFNGGTIGSGGSYIELANSASLGENAATLTMSAWVKFDNLNTQNFIIYRQDASDVSNQGFYDAGAGSLYFHPENPWNANYGYVSNSGLYTTGEWVHIVMVFDGNGTGNSGRLKAYINGNQVTLTYNGTIPSTTGSSSSRPLRIGGRRDGNAGFSGSIDQVRIFNTALTQSQVTELVRGYYPGTPTNVTYVKPGYTGRNTDGTIESQVSANQDAGFSIVSYNDSTGSGTVGHGLKSTPQLIIQKAVDISQDWYVYIPPGIIDANYNYLVLNSTAAKATTSSTPPTATTFNPVSSGRYIAYVWHSVPKYSAIGSYTGNGSTTGPIVSTGFKPGWLMVKNTANNLTSWGIIDSKRSPVNPRNLYLFADSSGTESSSGDVDFNDNGFQIKSSSNFLNQSGNKIIYMAFAE